MVDLRPLLFVNFLLFMLLVTAGFVRVEHRDLAVGSTIPDPSIGQAEPARQPEPEDLSERLQPTNDAAQTPEQIVVADDSATDNAVKDNSATDTAVTNDAGTTDHTTKEPLTEQLVSVEEAEASIFKDAAVFEQPVQPPHKEASATALIQQYGSAAKPEKPMVVSYSNEPKKAPLTTGKLIVTSNVADDVVLVNGKPYGPTKLELELTPGSYSIEVAKNGYSSWSTQVDVRRGQVESLAARLEHYTTVEYVDGVWKNGIMTGEGSYRQQGDLTYNGSFINGKFHGSGSVRYANGMKYQGEWFEGEMKGKGSLTTPEGDTYVGEFDDNKFNGEGTLTKATGDVYSGFWIEGVLNGQGSLTTKDGLLYVGGFSNNLFHGSGSLTYPDGGHYEGSFSNGMFHGKGSETYANGKKYVGQFIDGLYHGNGEILNPNGSKITGTFKDGLPFGKATLTTAEGEVFTARSSEPGVCYRLKSYRATECPKLDGW